MEMKILKYTNIANIYSQKWNLIGWELGRFGIGTKPKVQSRFSIFHSSQDKRGQ